MVCGLTGLGRKNDILRLNINKAIIIIYGKRSAIRRPFAVSIRMRTTGSASGEKALAMDRIKTP